MRLAIERVSTQDGTNTPPRGLFPTMVSRPTSRP
ncbi:hypothetical protein FHS42_005557 [Streptomyces zagrosensis]|uniref:Uncharacterized protein n=1 Tax=Streptomyces zagrosensis TaxID=1042984 RepID=A0A7W9QDU7_9ACTN|nr:hypothetical protein [Streptomyces zagrosensis]